MLLLCKTRSPRLRSLGPLLVTSVLPFVVPEERMVPPDPWADEDDAGDAAANEDAGNP